MRTQRFPSGSIHDDDFEALRTASITRALDVGANRGQSIVTIKSLAPDAEIWAFEPSLELLPAVHRIAQRYEDVHVVAAGCSRSPALATLFTPIARGIVFDQLSSLHPLDPVHTLDLVQHSGFGWCTADDLKIGETGALFVPLDLVFGPESSVVDLLKIDVEGAELEVVVGGVELVRRDLPLIVAERPDDELIALLSGIGYEHHRSKSGQNSLFVHPARDRGLKRERLVERFDHEVDGATPTSR